jgi:hypothetical protein
MKKLIMNKIKSGAQGISGKNVKLGQMLSDHGSQTVSALNKAEVGLMDNRGHKSRRLPFSSIKIEEITFFKVGFSFIDSILDSVSTFFKR